MDILQYIDDNKKTCKVETDTGHMFKLIFECPICKKTFDDTSPLHHHI